MTYIIQILISLAIRFPLIWVGNLIISRIEQRHYNRRVLTHRIPVIRNKVTNATSSDELYSLWEELNEVFRQVTDKKVAGEIHRINDTIYNRIRQFN
jgi:hypothetical protein